jgi:hypothetical protein
MIGLGQILYLQDPEADQEIEIIAEKDQEDLDHKFILKYINITLNSNI